MFIVAALIIGLQEGFYRECIVLENGKDQIPETHKEVHSAETKEECEAWVKENEGQKVKSEQPPEQLPEPSPTQPLGLTPAQPGQPPAQQPEQPPVQQPEQPTVPAENGKQNGGVRETDPRWFWVSVGQNVLLGCIALVLIGILFYGLYKLINMREMVPPNDYNRNLITFLVAFGTILIGVMAATTAMFIREKERFAGVKDVFTVLVGILGTIIGFYFGQTTDDKTSGSGQVIVSEAQFNPSTLASNANANVSFALSGGKQPYHYVMTFPKAPSIKVEGDSVDGKISKDFSVQIPQGVTSLDYVIDGTDGDGTAFKYLSPKDVPAQP